MKIGPLVAKFWHLALGVRPVIMTHCVDGTQEGLITSKITPHIWDLMSEQQRTEIEEDGDI